MFDVTTISKEVLRGWLQNVLENEIIPATRVSKTASLHGLLGSALIQGKYHEQKFKDGSWAPGLTDLKGFYAISLKKSTGTKLATREELIALSEQGYNPETDTIDQKVFKGYCISAFTATQLIDTLGNTLTHYGELCVPGGFAAVSGLLFLRQLVDALKLGSLFTPEHKAAIDKAFLVALFVFYEGPYGLGGTNLQALAWYPTAIYYAQTGKDKNKDSTATPEEIEAKLFTDWQDMLGDDVRTTFKTRAVFDIHLLIISLRELGKLHVRGVLDSEKHPRLWDLTFDNIDSPTLEQVALMLVFLRQAAAGKGLQIEEAVDDAANFDPTGEDDEGVGTGSFNKLDDDLLNGDHHLLKILRNIKEIYTLYSESVSDAVNEDSNDDGGYGF